LLLSALGTAAAAPDTDLIRVERLQSQACVSHPGDGHEHGDHRHLGAFEVEKEETEKADLDIGFLAVVVAFLGDEPVHSAIAPWDIAPLHPIDSIAACAARGPPTV